MVSIVFFFIFTLSLTVAVFIYRCVFLTSGEQQGLLLLWRVLAGS